MSTPELYPLIPEDRYQDAQRAVMQQLETAPSEISYLNGLLAQYSRPTEARSSIGEVLYTSGQSNTSEVDQLSRVARFVMLDQAPTLSADADAFFRGSLLATHFIKTAAPGVSPGIESTHVIRRYFIESSPWTKVEYFSAEALDDVAYTRMPARDTTDEDSNRMSEEPLVRQARISRRLHALLNPYQDEPVIPSHYERIAHRTVRSLKDHTSDYPEESFLMGYRFVVKQFTQPDILKDIHALQNDLLHIKSYANDSETLAQMERELGREPKAELLSLKDICRDLVRQFDAIKASIDATELDSINEYKYQLSTALNSYAAERYPQLSQRNVIQMNGRYYGLMSTSDDNGMSKKTPFFELDTAITLLGTLETIEIIEAPTQKSFSRYLKTERQSDLETTSFVPAFRISEPSLFYNDEEDEYVSVTPHDEPATYTIPFIYKQLVAGVHFTNSDTDKLGS